MDSIANATRGSSALGSARIGIDRALMGLGRDAAAVASANVANGGDVLPALVDAQQQRLMAEAGARMMATADEMIGSLLDMWA